MSISKAKSVVFVDSETGRKTQLSAEAILLSDAVDRADLDQTGATAATPKAVATVNQSISSLSDRVTTLESKPSGSNITLSDAVNSTSGASANVAATPYAVKQAYDLANTANTTASQANTTATQAKTTAGSAQTAAVSAQSAASNAQTTANNAQTTANNAQTTANNAIPKSGARGQIAGNETSASLSGPQTITVSSADTTIISTSGATTLTFTAADVNVCAVKVICLNATAATTLTISGATWANAGSAPTWGDANARLILVANFIAGVVIINTFDNSQG